jgi:HME family heavy-metal exporter
VRAQIVVKFFGDDLDALRAAAEALRQRLAGIPGLADLQVEKQVRIPQLEIIVDHTRAALFGLQPQTIVEHLERLSNGRVVSRLVDGTRRFDVVLRLDDARRTTQGLGDLLLETPYGWVPVRHVAEVQEGDGPNQILRENGRRRAVVLANADGAANMTQLIADIRRELAAMPLPKGVYSSLEGTFQAEEEASRTIAALSLISLATIFAILYSRYRSAVLALIIMGSVPLALIGSVAALWLAGQPLSVASMIGFITLTGIASRNGILKISHYINLALIENMPLGRELVVRGSLERMTPVLMTALAAGLALLPLMVDPAAPGKEVLYPVATTIFGGLFSTTLLDAFLTPILFLRLGQKPLARLIDSARGAQAGIAEPVTRTY